MNEKITGLSKTVLEILRRDSQHITVLTGAGISAESGIPTFRGPEGYWTINSKVYMPETMATKQMFDANPEEVWQWYLYRLGVCEHAKPNQGHNALVKMEKKLGDRFSLITQNVDNLHIRAGNSLERTYQIHGNITKIRCSRNCHSELHKLDQKLFTKHEKKQLTVDEIDKLHCNQCGNWMRPHVLWFDEYYDEMNYRFDSAMAIADITDILIIVGTSGSTTLPNHIANTIYARKKCIIDINIDDDPFSDLAESSQGGQFIKTSSSKILPDIAKTCL
jgi:NAD-dependent deacetylase